MRARKQVESMRRDEMPPWTVLEGVRWMEVVLKFVWAVGDGVVDWDMSLRPRVWWIGVCRTS
jgi:hypothetical protein